VSREGERRTGVRFITDLTVAVRSAEGEALDDRATAHDVSTAGFKLETQAQLEPEQTIAFSLDLPEGARASGRGKVVWAKREAFAVWAGVRVISMSWSDKRRLAKLLKPDTVDWERIFDLAFRTVVILTIVVAAQRLVFARRVEVGELGRFLPRFAALMLMGWAALGMLRGRR
jgi:hypothetical protein